MKLMIKPKPPFDFDLSAKIFSSGDRHIRKYEDGKYWQLIRLEDKLALVIISSTGTVDEPILSVELKSDGKISNDDRKAARKIVSSLFNLDMDLGPFYGQVKKDRILSELARKLRGLKSPTTETVFEALVSSIVEQQISLIVAHGMEEKMIKAFGDALEVDGERYYAFPAPQRLAPATIGQLRGCGLSSRKAEYIRDISKTIVDGGLDLEKFKGYGDAGEIIAELSEIRGIGVWTAEMTVIRGMHRLEAIPADDIGLQRHISHYYRGDRRISSREVRRIAEKWGKWKGLAGFYLIMAEVSGI